MNIALSHQICIELGQLGSTIVSIQTGYNPQICSNSCRRQCISGALSPANYLCTAAPSIPPSVSLVSAHPGLWEDYTVSHQAYVMLFPLSRLIHSTGLRARKLGVSALAGIKAKTCKHVRGRLRGGWGWQSSLCMIC